MNEIHIGILVKKIVLCLIAIVSALEFRLPECRAAVIFTDTFESHANGNIIGTGGYTEPAAVSPDMAVVTGGLGYSGGDITIAGGNKNVQGGPGYNAGNKWPLQNTFASQTGDVYFSFTTSWDLDSNADNFFFVLSNTTPTTGTAMAGSGQVSVTGNTGGTGGIVNGRLRFDTTGNTTMSSASSLINDGTVAFVVGKLYKSAGGNYDRLALWVNPTSTTESLASALGGAAISRDIGISSIDRFYVLGGSTIGPADIISLDNIIIGTTYQDVVVTKPSSWAMLLGGFSLPALVHRCPADLQNRSRTKD